MQRESGFCQILFLKEYVKPRLSRGCYTRKVSELMPKGWMAFWRKDVASVDSGIFIRWAREFIKQIREKYGLQDWIVLFYDACRAHMTYEVINLFYTNKIAVIALPAHSSDRTRPLDVSVFGPMKHYANSAIARIAKEQSLVHRRFERLPGIDVWESIDEAFGSAFSISNIRSGFRKTGLWPYNPQTLVQGRIRRTFEDATLASVEEFIQEKNILVLQLSGLVCTIQY